MHTSEHISKQFDAELEGVRSRVLQMGGLVESQITRAIEGFIGGNLDLIEQTIADDHRVNALEVMLDDDCAHIIARRQPTAGDLRLIMTVVKTITDLERIGDEAAKIARMSRLIHGADRLHRPRFPDIHRASDVAIGMLRKALDAFARLDTLSAAQIVREDELIDAEFTSIMRQLITFMMEDPRTISLSLEILFVAKSIERIGDHAKNMAEYVIYMVKGKDVRHVTVEELERQAAG
jgi:phosphate transport system protein